MQHIKNLLLATLIALVPLIGYADEQIGNAAVIEKNAEQKEALRITECIQEALFHMPPKLRPTLTRQDIKDLLRAEEEACLLAIKNEFKISDKRWEKCLTTINDAKIQRQDIDYKQSNPDKDHSLQSLDPESFKRIIESLEAYGINPNAVDIIYDKQCEAFAGIGVYRGRLFIHFTPINDQKMKNVSGVYQQYHRMHVPAYKATHIAEIHSLQVVIVLYYLMESGYEISFIQQQQSWKNWNRIHEKIADLMPLLLPQPIGSLEALLMRGIEEYLNKKTAITWNQSDPDATHPDACAELLPWVLRILACVQ